MTNAIHDNNFRSSLDLLGEDERVRNIRELGAMFKSYFAHQNAEAERENARLAERCRANERGARLDRDIAVLAKSFPPAKAAPRASTAEVTPPTESDLLAKAASHLYFDDRLNAAERGALLLGISARSFAKAQRTDQHPVAARVEEIRTALEKAQQERDLGPAAPFIEEAIRHLAGGIRDADDHGRLEYLLRQAHAALAAGDTDALGVGDAR